MQSTGRVDCHTWPDYLSSSNAGGTYVAMMICIKQHSDA